MISNVEVSTDEEGTGIEANEGERSNMLVDLFKIHKRIVLTAHDHSHTRGMKMSTKSTQL